MALHLLHQSVSLDECYWHDLFKKTKEGKDNLVIVTFNGEVAKRILLDDLCSDGTYDGCFYTLMICQCNIFTLQERTSCAENQPGVFKLPQHQSLGMNSLFLLVR
jgi:hypothetical protein